MTTPITDNLKNEVLDFLSTMKSSKIIQCECGKPRQSVGYICNSCGMIVTDLQECNEELK